MTTKTVEVDYIGYVRQRLDDMPTSAWNRVAADAEVSIRTLYNLRDNKVDPAYSTVKKLYDLLKATAAPAK